MLSLESADPSLALIENNPLTTMTTRPAEPINRIVPISAVEAAKLQKQLLHAGLPSARRGYGVSRDSVAVDRGHSQYRDNYLLSLGRSLNSFLILGVFAAADWLLRTTFVVTQHDR